MGPRDATAGYINQSRYGAAADTIEVQKYSFSTIATASTAIAPKINSQSGTPIGPVATRRELLREVVSLGMTRSS